MTKQVYLHLSSGYEVAKLSIVPCGKGQAEAVIEYGDHSTEGIGEFHRIHPQYGNVWSTPLYRNPVPMNKRIDVAVEAFYSNKELILNAINGCNYSEDVKETLRNYINERKF